MKRKILRLSILTIIFVTSYAFAQENAEEKLNLMHNSLLLGLEDMGIKIAVEIISKDEFEPVREKALFSISEYLFSEGVLGNLDESTRLYKGNIQYINKSYTFYLKLNKEYPQGEYFEIAKQRIEFLEFNYQTNLLFRSLANYIENERIIVDKKLNFINHFIETENENLFLFFTEGKKPNPFELVNKYFDDIIVNNPSQAIYAYYLKLLSTLSQHKDIDLFSGKLDNSAFSVNFSQSFDKKKEYVKSILDILNVFKKKYPSHPLTIQSYLVAVSYFIKANIWDYDSYEVKKWLELALKNDNNKLGIKHLVTKEYIIKTDFDDE